MPLCPRCSSAVTAGSRFCPACGAEIESLSQAPTEIATAARPRTPSAAGGRAESSGARGSGAFPPGHVLAGRYRIVGLLGRGGMGEVYRADDLKLDQPVSLKFLPGALAHDASLLERFHAEVRNARQVSHPNVCRVYDIGEADGLHFISMEFVDGEDLGSLLRRIGHLPAAKAGEIARHICAGLAAAHDKGVLHRDLKPSNVMIDGEGRARITDFGLAVRAGEAAGEVSGTPAYMAPEQFEGVAATPQTDLYALGLILFEIYTGRRAFEGRTFEEWKSRHASVPAPPASRAGAPVDDAVERVIARCLEKDPSRRPISAFQVAAALPGGDPLAAALAAGETPSPGLVAASGGEGALAPRTAWLALAAAVAILAAIVVVSRDSTDLGLARMDRSAEVLAQRGRDLAAQFGYGDGVVDAASWVSRDYAQLRWRSRHQVSTAWRDAMGAWGPPLTVVHRQSPRWMVPRGDDRVLSQDPPMTVSGMVRVAVDARGRLAQFVAVPPEVDSAYAATTTPDWSAFVREAGLAESSLREVEPVWVPASAFDARREWVTPAPWDSTIPLRVSAASFAGRPVEFVVRPPWAEATRMSERRIEAASWISNVVGVVIVTALLAATAFFAQRHLRTGRGDRRGAVRLALGLFGASMLAWIASGHHVAELPGEFGLFWDAMERSLFVGLFFMLGYLAVEPFVRRHTPEFLIGWTRVLDGRLRDPRVGRDVLLGATLGAASALVVHLGDALPAWIPFERQTTLPTAPWLLLGPGTFIGGLAATAAQSVADGLALFGIMFLVLGLVRRRRPTFVIFALLLAASRLGGEHVALGLGSAVLVGVLFATAIMRVGLLGGMIHILVHKLLVAAPLPLTPGAAQMGPGLVVMAGLALVLIAAFRISLGARPPFALDAPAHAAGPAAP